MRPELRSLTGVRFVAALYVFLFHIHTRWPLTENMLLGNFLSQGAVGMTVFFMLSGYVLAHRYAGALDLGSYARNRFARIYPGYTAAAVVTLPWLIVQTVGSGADQWAVTKLMALLTAHTFMLQAWVPPMFGYWNFPGSWSISAEAFFYAVFPLVLMSMENLSRRRLLQTAITLYALSIVPAVLYAVSGSNNIALFYAVPIFRLPEFMLGACLFFLTPFTPAWLLRLSAPAVLLIVLYFAATGSLLLYVGHNWLAVPVVGLTLLALAKSVGPFTAVLSSPLLNWGGRISYCLYSFQPLVILALISLGGGDLFSSNVHLAVTAFAGLLALSAAGYHLIEEPMRKLLSGKSKNALASAVT